MLRNIIGALAGEKLSEHTDKLGGTTGAILGAVTATALRRASLPAMVALGVGGYFAKKYFDRKEAEKAAQPPSDPSEKPGMANAA